VQPAVGLGPVTASQHPTQEQRASSRWISGLALGVSPLAARAHERALCFCIVPARPRHYSRPHKRVPTRPCLRAGFAVQAGRAGGERGRANSSAEGCPPVVRRGEATASRNLGVPMFGPPAEYRPCDTRAMVMDGW